MLVEAEIWTVARTDKGNAVLVKPVGSDRAVPIFIGQLEAQSILFGLASVPVPRPMTHDLFISVLEKSNITIDRVEITDLKDRTFYSRLVLKQGLKRRHVFVICLLCALSDAILMAVGVSGFSFLITANPWLETIARYGGALFLFTYGMISFYSAISKNQTLAPAGEGAPCCRQLVPAWH